MARKKNDGKGRMGGRAKGTPNKITANVKDWLSELLEGDRTRFVEQFNTLQGDDYVKHYISLMPYVAPKMQSVDLKATVEQEYKELERLLDIAPDEAIKAIADKVMELSELKKNGNG